jgi:hypothetical protein
MVFRKLPQDLLEVLKTEIKEKGRGPSLSASQILPKSAGAAREGPFLNGPNMAGHAGAGQEPWMHVAVRLNRTTPLLSPSSRRGGVWEP